MNSHPETVYACDRRFEVVTWGVGHRGLVLRSIPEVRHHSRIEVWFKPAYAVCLEPWLEGIQITRGAADASACRKLIGRPIEAWEELFSVRSGDGLGWVLAGGVHGREHSRSMEEVPQPTFDHMWDWGSKPGIRQLFSVSIGR